jgi:hypothetical protein
MRLGTETGSVVNHFLSRGTIGQPEPVVGMGVTFLSWTDRSAGTIFRVFHIGRALAIETRDDISTCVSGSSHDGSAEWAHKINVNGHRSIYRFRRDKWERVTQNENGRWVKAGGKGLRIGERDTYYDPSF